MQTKTFQVPHTKVAVTPTGLSLTKDGFVVTVDAHVNAFRLVSDSRRLPALSSSSSSSLSSSKRLMADFALADAQAAAAHKLPWDAAPARPASRTLLLRPRAATEAKPKQKSAPLGAPLARARSRSLAPASARCESARCEDEREQECSLPRLVAAPSPPKRQQLKQLHRKLEIGANGEIVHSREPSSSSSKGDKKKSHCQQQQQQAQTQLLDQSFSELYAVRDVTDVDTAWLSSVTGDIGDSETSLDEEAEMKRNEARMAELCRQEELAFKNKLIPLDSLAPGSLIRENLLDQVAAKEAAASLKLNSSSTSGSIKTSCITLDFSAKD